MMKTRKSILRVSAILAAVMLTGGMSLAAKPVILSAAPITAYAEEEGTFAKNDTFEYKKYSQYVEVTRTFRDSDTLEIPSQIDGLPVKKIGIYGFQLCKAKTIIFPDTLEEIGPYAFGMCENLESVTFPDSVKVIKFHAFECCPKLSQINFPAEPVWTGDFTFDETPWLEAQRKKDPLVIVNGSVIDGRTCTGDVVIPKGVTYVATGAFSKNDKITSVKFPASVKHLQEDTFWQCSALTSVEMPGVTELGIGVFGDCDKLTDLKISGKLTKIDQYTFADNDASATITFYGSQSAWNSVQKPDGDAFLQRARLVFDESYQEPVDEVIGDINADGKCDSADAVLLQKHLLTIEFLNEEKAKIADLDKNGKLEASDLALLKQNILRNK